MIKVKWDVEEIVALIDLYQRVKNEPIVHINSELLDLSNALIGRANKLGIVHDEKYRNLNGMKLMYKKIMYLASEGKDGLHPTNTSFGVVYNMYKELPEAFNLILIEFNMRYRN